MITTEEYLQFLNLEPMAGQKSFECKSCVELIDRLHKAEMSYNGYKDILEFNKKRMKEYRSTISVLVMMNLFSIVLNVGLMWMMK